MNSTLMPSKPGQLCKIVSDVADLEQEEVYIVAEDPAGFDGDEDVLVVNLKDLQRNIKNPENAERLQVPKDELVVIAEDLESYIKSWNDK